jgi:hypothetical protein
MIPDTAILYSERQHFSRWWFLLGIEPIVIALGLAAGGIIPWVAVLGVLLFSMVAPSVLVLSQLETVISRDDIRLRFRPWRWRWKVIPREMIVKAYVRQYDPLGEYGGWGIKYGGKKEGWCYNARGKFGLQLELDDGKRLMIGTMKPEELTAAAEVFMKPTEL